MYYILPVKLFTLNEELSKEILRVKYKFKSCRLANFKRYCVGWLLCAYSLLMEGGYAQIGGDFPPFYQEKDPPKVF